VNLIKIP